MHAWKILLLLTVFSAGCGKAPWTHPTKSAASDLKSDLADCQGASGGFTSDRGADELAARVQSQDRCLESKGWRRGP